MIMATAERIREAVTRLWGLPHIKKYAGAELEATVTAWQSAMGAPPGAGGVSDAELGSWLARRMTEGGNFPSPHDAVTAIREKRGQDFGASALTDADKAKLRERCKRWEEIFREAAREHWSWRKLAVTLAVIDGGYQPKRKMAESGDMPDGVEDMGALMGRNLMTTLFVTLCRSCDYRPDPTDAFSMTPPEPEAEPKFAAVAEVHAPLTRTTQGTGGPNPDYVEGGEPGDGVPF